MPDSLFRQLGSIVSNATNTKQTQSTAALTTEITDRQNADTTLQTAITNEILVRQSTDSALSNTISELDTARQNDVATLTSEFPHNIVWPIDPDALKEINTLV